MAALIEPIRFSDRLIKSDLLINRLYFFAFSGALTKGDRRAATGADLTEFNFDTPYGRQALKNMYASICQKVVASGISASCLTKDKIDFSEFNQIMMVSKY